MNKRWVETILLFLVFAGGYTAIGHFLLPGEGSWTEHALQGIVFAVLMVAALGWRERRAERSEKRPRGNAK